MTKRSMKVRVGATPSLVFKKVEMETLQGIVLSLVFSSPMESDLPETLGVETSLLADDGIIWKTGKSTNYTQLSTTNLGLSLG